MAQTAEVLANDFATRLAAIVGNDRVLTSPEERRFFSLDFSEQPGELPLAVVKPRSCDDVSEIVRISSQAGIACCVVYKLSGACGWKMTPPVINLALAALVTGWMLDYPREYRNFTIEHGMQIKARMEQRMQQESK